MQVLTNMLDYTMPGIKTLLKGYSEATKKNKLSDFVEHYWHYDNITKKLKTQFVKSYIAWAKKRKDIIKVRQKQLKYMPWQKMVSLPCLPALHRPKC